MRAVFYGRHFLCVMTHKDGVYVCGVSFYKASLVSTDDAVDDNAGTAI